MSDKVTDLVMSLPADERLALVERILESLNLPTQADIDKAWAEDADRRLKESDTGAGKENGE